MREVVNAILYSLRSGCQWRMLPKEFPPDQTVYHHAFRTLFSGSMRGFQSALLRPT
jgi:putative transposase